VVADDTFRRIDALVGVGLALARTAPSGRVLLARIANAIDLQWIPQPWGDEIVSELVAARSAASEPIPVRRVKRILRTAWGALELDDFEPQPVAVTPLSQVHRGVIDGLPVAIKVLRPGLAATVRQDLVVLDGLLAPLAAAFPALNARAILAEFRERVLDELDLEHEAAVQRRFHRALRGHPRLYAPAPLTSRARPEVLVTEWVSGVPLLEASDRDGAAALLVRFVFGAMRWGIIHADPLPDNVLVLDDGRLAILDFGATRATVRARVTAVSHAHDAFMRGDVEAFGAALERLGWLPASEGPLAFELARYVLGELGGPSAARLDSAAVMRVRDRLFARSDQLQHAIGSGKLSPVDLWPARGVAQLFATIAQVGATGCWAELARAALRDGFSAERAR
jgi:predicted unusual protein kinase regulating ubiquinone biosynthesis (AarF/ABC1/UbiB family)